MKYNVQFTITKSYEVDADSKQETKDLVSNNPDMYYMFEEAIVNVDVWGGKND